MRKSLIQSKKLTGLLSMKDEKALTFNKHRKRLPVLPMKVIF